MRMRFARARLPRFFLALAIVLLASSLVGYARAQPPADSSVALESAKTSLDQIEAILGRDEISVRRITELRERLVGVRDSLRTQLSVLEPRLSEADARLKQLGPPPAKDAPAEPADLAEQRRELTQALGAVDGAVRQYRLLLVRADQVGERLTERRSALSTREILERTPSILNPSFWTEVATAQPQEIAKLGGIARDWARNLGERWWLRLSAAFACIGLLLWAAAAVRAWWRRRFANGGIYATRFAKARAALWVLFSVAAFTPLIVFAMMLLLDALGLWPQQVEDLAAGLVASVVVAATGRGAARALLSPEGVGRRLIALDDRAVTVLASHMIWGTRILGAAILLQVVHKALTTPVVLSIATNMLFAAFTAGTLAHLVVRLRQLEETAAEAERVVIPWVRPIGWLLVAIISAGLVAGFAGFAAFVSLRVVVAATLGSVLYILLVGVDALFTEVFSADTPRGRALAANLGIQARNVGLIGILLSAVIRVVLTALAVMLIFGPWEASTADLMETVQSVPLGLRIGEISISFRALLSAVVVAIAVLLATRVAQRWLQSRLLPQTGIETSLQLSIATIFGYVGVIAAIALALGALGIDLQKIAIVAGALSVGIGFGLQSIVSNFVSGLILLAERPIRVGDSIVVKGEEGWVRRIRVRATEIETFERASVIIPNSELITGLVKNWTHANTMGRVSIKVGVGYDSDPDQVREILEKVANDHPQIVSTPPPRAFLLGFGDSALDFDLRCVIANVDQGLSVRSDLHFGILKAFRAAGVEIPFPQRDVNLRGTAEAVESAS